MGTILKKNWDKFSAALGDWKTFEIFLGELEKMRDAGAHGRDLLPHQKQLANGIAGEIRTRLIRYRSKQETCEDYFPRIESVRDSLGNVWTPNNKSGLDVFTKQVLRPGDKLDYVITASDPMGEELDYRLEVDHRTTTEWQTTSEFSVEITEDHIGKHFSVGLEIKSRRSHHAMTHCDDEVLFHYSVLPKINHGK